MTDDKLAVSQEAREALVDLIAQGWWLNSRKTLGVAPEFLPDSRNDFHAAARACLADFEAQARLAGERQWQEREKSLRGIIFDALGGFRCTQKPEHYPANHWARRAMAILSEEPPAASTGEIG